jgi:hypothetical protein
LDALTDNRLLGRKMRCVVVGERWGARIRQPARCIKADEIGGVGLIERDDPTMRPGDEEAKDGDLGNEEDGRVKQQALAAEPLAALELRCQPRQNRRHPAPSLPIDAARLAAAL